MNSFKAGLLTTRLDVVIFEFVSFFFTVFYFYISPFLVINLPLVMNGINQVLSFIFPNYSKV